MFVYELLAPGGAHEVIPAILAAAMIAADERNHIAIALDLYGVARLLLDLTDEALLLPSLIGMSHLPSLARIARLDGIGLKLHGIREDNQLAIVEKIAVKPIHYHSVSLLQLRRKPACGHREDSESVGTDGPNHQQCQRQG